MMNSSASFPVVMPPCPMMGIPWGARDLVHLMHLEQRDRLDRRAREPALHVADHRAARLHVDGHTHDGVDHRQGIRACLDAAARVLADVGLVGRDVVMRGFFVTRRQAATTCADISG